MRPGNRNHNKLRFFAARSGAVLTGRFPVQARSWRRRTKRPGDLAFFRTPRSSRHVCSAYTQHLPPVFLGGSSGRLL